MRYRGPEIPGVAFWGYMGTRLDKQADGLCCKYFIAPAVKLEEDWEVNGGSAQMVLHNIGGMNARDVRVAAYDAAETSLLGTEVVPLLKAGERKSVTVNLRRPDDKPKLSVLPSTGYTELNPPAPVEVYPHRQVRGMPLKICWTPSGGTRKVEDSETLAFTDLLRQEVRHTVSQLKRRRPPQTRLRVCRSRSMRPRRICLWHDSPRWCTSATRSLRTLASQRPGVYRAWLNARGA